MSTEDLSARTYVQWDADGVDDVPPGEAQVIQAVAQQLEDIQRAYQQKNGRSYGGFYATRTREVVKGLLIVPSNLPPHLRQTELFKNEGVYPAACRYYSSEPSDPNHVDDEDEDRIPRGLDVKIFGVRGKKFADGPGLPIQDIELNNSSAPLDFADPQTVQDILNRLNIQSGGDLTAIHRYLEEEQRDDVLLHKGRDHLRQYESQGAYRFGKYIARYRLQPSAQTAHKLRDSADRETDQEEEDEYESPSKRLREFHKRHNAEFDLQVQLCEDLQTQPVASSSGGSGAGRPQAWDEDAYPFQTVATLVVPQQDGSFGEKRARFWEERVCINPWHGLVGLQPLGGASRLRRVVYPANYKLRSEWSGIKGVELLSIKEIP